MYPALKRGVVYRIRTLEELRSDPKIVEDSGVFEHEDLDNDIPMLMHREASKIGFFKLSKCLSGKFCIPTTYYTADVWHIEPWMVEPRWKQKRW